MVIGDLLCVCFGEVVLVDGVVEEGWFLLDELMIIGEFMFVIWIIGDYVIGGMMN